MSNKEVNQVGVFEKLRDKEIKQREAAMILNISSRQIRRKLKLFRKDGPESLIHGLRGRPSNNQVDPVLVQRALDIVEEDYRDFGPTLASEHLCDDHQIVINPETLRLKMIEADLWKPKKRKATHREWRERKECVGELVQSDGSNHDWFEGRLERCDLLAFIDDATSEILWAEFAPETTLGYLTATSHYIEQHGLPKELYVDKGKVFRVNNNNPDNDKLTQYGRALDELDVGLTFARSPEAKGRVERLFGTLQDRLVKEMRLKGISTIEEANKFLQEEYLPKHNQKYAVVPKSKTNLHRSAEGYDLDSILCIKEKRTLTNDFTLRYKNQWFQLEKKQKTIISPRDTITVVTQINGALELWIREIKLNSRIIDKPIATKKVVSKNKEHKPWVPPVDHPWRNYSNIKSQKPDISTLQKEDILTLV